MSNNEMEERVEKKKQGRMLPKVIICVLCVVFGFTLGKTYQLIKDSQAIEGLLGSKDTSSTSKKLDPDGIADKITYLQKQIDGYYLENIDYENVEDYIYKGMLAGLGDPYSEYYTKEECALMLEATSGTYCGIGALLQQNREEGTCVVTSVFANSPAKEAGLLPGDMIVKVDDRDILGMDLNKIVTYVKGEEDSRVILTIVRNGEPLEMELTRRTIEVETVTYEMLEDNIGYILLSEFDEVSLTQFQKALTDLQGQGMKGLIVDLRNNPGGVLTVANDILDQILPEGLLVYTEDKYGNRQDYYSDEEHQMDLPMAVLMNEYSASASEIFVGAMKDYDRATLVGTTTYGKGIVQRIVDLKDGSAVKLTIAKYYTPSGENIHGVGIAPDIEVSLPEGVTFSEELSHDKDGQLQKAMEVLKEEVK